jgi:hypothetical protein
MKLVRVLLLLFVFAGSVTACDSVPTAPNQLSPTIGSGGPGPD